MSAFIGPGKIKSFPLVKGLLQSSVGSKDSVNVSITRLLSLYKSCDKKEAGVGWGDGKASKRQLENSEINNKLA